MIPTLPIITQLIGFIFLIVGLLFRMFLPKKINPLYGYRTSSSRKNLDTWKTANKYSASLMIFEGIALLFIGFIASTFPDSGAIGSVVGFLLFIGSIILLIGSTEKHLDKLFDKDGNRKMAKAQLKYKV